MKAANLFSLKGRVALVTGASSGLGNRFARTLANNGAAVVLVARRVAKLRELQESIKMTGGREVAVESDVTDRACTSRAFDAAEEAFGTVTRQCAATFIELVKKVSFVNEFDGDRTPRLSNHLRGVEFRVPPLQEHQRTDRPRRPAKANSDERRGRSRCRVSIMKKSYLI